MLSREKVVLKTQPTGLVLMLPGEKVIQPGMLYNPEKRMNNHILKEKRNA